MSKRQKLIRTPDEGIYKDDVVDNLTSTDTDKPLSANQGRELNETKANLLDLDHTASLSVVIDPAGDSFDIDFITNSDGENPSCALVFVGFAYKATNGDRYFARIYTINTNFTGVARTDIKLVHNLDGGGIGQTTSLGTLSVTALSGGFNVTKTSGTEQTNQGRLSVRILTGYNNVESISGI